LDWKQFVDEQKSFSLIDRSAFLILGIHASLLEESLFRGYLQKGLSQKFGPQIAIIISAAVFALYHLNFSLVALLGKFILGVGLGLISQRQNSLMPSAVAHTCFWVCWGIV
jgi:membrane protease YdiL (CAAX protease family)